MSRDVQWIGANHCAALCLGCQLPQPIMLCPGSSRAVSIAALEEIHAVLDKITTCGLLSLGFELLSRIGHSPA